MHWSTIIKKTQWIWIVFLQVQFEGISSLSPLWDSVTTNVYQEYDVQEGDDILTVRVNMGEYSSTDLVVGEDIRRDARLILTCIAHHGPAEWVYSGDGNPNYIRNTTTENIGSDGKRLPMEETNGAAKRYIATLTLGQTGITTTKDTGRYNCLTASPETGMKYKTISAYYHVYVPAKQKLFIRKPEDVYYDLNKSAARIPCGVTNPKASVTLQKFVQGNLEFIPNESMLYHPISGYYPKNDIRGTYLCTAAFNNTFDFVYFTLAASTDQNTKKFGKRPSKKPFGYVKPEDLEWLMYPSNTRSTIKTTKRPKPSPTSSVKTPYVPFHLRYSTTTYGPFQTFYTVQTTTPKSPYNKYKTRPTVKTNPFNSEKYPSELFNLRPVTKGPYSQEIDDQQQDVGLPFPEDLISYRPVLNNFKNTRPSHTANQTAFQIFNSKKPTPPIVVQTTPRTMQRNTRTTPRKYRPYTMPTTQMPIVIPESVICSQFTCGVNAVCFASMIYNRTTKELNAEPGCKCVENHLGNPYLNCYLPKVAMDPNLLLFNLSAFGRSPLLEEAIYSTSESESGSQTDSSGSNDEEHHTNNGKTTSVDIIDM
ncbi:uncharacterized protein LOC118437537 [Folsomia candida]|uniref:uncharacterized protein LOC118437537 n=1 Tax=Folsomia candida TaxID=158441 RepID=UPI00160551B9|nr:uncharacterized protein LOC118437537 [Folsomia candida]